MVVRLIVSLMLLLVSSADILAEPLAKVQLKPANSTHLFPFFKTPTPVLSYNNQIPGPFLRQKQGSVLTVDVINGLQEPTSIHWHGLRIDNAMDGVPGVTQDPIQPGAVFTYRLKLEEAGTFWYHPHFNAGEQLERGLKGVLIVEEREKQPWSRDVVWLMDDWRFQQDGTIFPHFNTHHDLMHEGRWGNAITVNGSSRPTLAVLPGERIRLRLINGANARVFSLSFNALAARVIAVDGRPVSAFFPFRQFVMAPGNRVDLDITIPADAAGKRYLLEDTFTRQTITMASIFIENVDPIRTPKVSPALAPEFIPAKLFDQISVTKTWDLNAVRGGKYGIGWSMNHRLWPRADTVKFAIGEPQKIRFINSSGRLHPMHLHGVFFRVLEVNDRPYDEPFTRDTVLVGPRESIVIGLVPEHDGIWLTHCHIQSHAEAGMMTTIQVE